MSGQAIATEAIVEWRGQAAPARHFVQNRVENRGLLQLVFRSWRERVEHEAPGVSCDSSRWVVREEQLGGQRTTRVTHAAAARRPRPPASSERKFADSQLAQMEQIASTYNWSPWKPGDARAQQHATQAPELHGDEDEIQLTRWQLRCDLLRIATFYRVTGAKRRAKQRVRREAAKAKFQRWAATVLAERRSQARPTPETRANQQETRQGQNAGKRRAETAPSYREARAYKQRATPDEMERRRLAPKRTRLTNTTQSTELGKRLRDNMEEVGRRCKAERRGDG